MNRITSTVSYGCRASYDTLDEWQKTREPWTVELRYQHRRMTVDFFTGPEMEPTTSDVLGCVLSDASGALNSRSFEEWADEYGLDTDSRSAEATYRKVRVQANKLAQLLGNDLDTFLYMDEDDQRRHCR